MPLTEIASFSVAHLQVLDKHGHLDAALDPGLPDADLLALYRAMLRSRQVDLRMLNLQRQGRIGTFPPCTGQEAAFVGPTFAMRPADWFVGSFREVGAHLMRGVPLERYLDYYAGYEEGAAYPAQERNLPVTVILASQLAHAVGLAYAMRYKGEAETAVLAFVGDGASSEGDFHEALNLAAVWKLPLVVIVQNNHWAISVPRAAQTASATLAQKAIAYGMPGLQVDGNDVLATYKATHEALERARAGEGPSLIEAVTYRMLMHTTADDPKKYRSEEEVEAWQSRDPLLRMRRLLEDRGLWSEAAEEQALAALKAEIEAAVQAFEAPKERPVDLPFDHVFGTAERFVAEQRADLLRRAQAEGPDA